MSAVRLVHTADLSPAHAAAAQALLRAAFDDLDDTDWEHALGGLHALALDGDGLVGHAALVQRRLLHGGRALRCGYLEAVAVRADRRRQGVGSALLAAAARFAADTGAAHVVASVGGHEAERQRFFAQMGFAPLSTRRVVALDSLTRTLAARQRAGITVPTRRTSTRRRTLPTVPVPRPVRGVGAVAAEA